MMNNKLTIAIVIVLFFLGSAKFILGPYFEKRSGIKIVKSVLSSWSKEDHLSAIPHWEDEDFYPPVYGLKEYMIKNKQFIKDKKGNKVSVIVDLKFEPNNNLPSNSEWEFIVKDTKYGWKVHKFRISHLNPSDFRKVQGRYDPEQDRRMLKKFLQQTDESYSPPETYTFEPTPDPVADRPGYKTIPASGN